MRLKALALAFTLATVVAAAQGTKVEYRTFATPEDAVNALAAAVKAGNLAEVVAIFAPDGKELAESSDPATAQQNRQIFAVAFKEGWHLVDQGANKKTLVIGNEDWPFPVPLAKQNGKWRFDAAAGKEEVIARRIGRNELAAIATCKTYVVAQQHYAKDAHDGKPAGLYAAALRSEPNRQNGLYWPAAKGQKRSPVGDLVADASAAEGRVAVVKEAGHRRDGQRADAERVGQVRHHHRGRGPQRVLIEVVNRGHQPGDRRRPRAGGHFSRGPAKPPAPGDRCRPGARSCRVQEAA
ncbi:MAG TPA: DUF2950 family protein [Vicinamibacterales bacterium]|nr:DUF2950 family protein [Vicinamibacterales bacterium]